MHTPEQCSGSALVSMRIRIQLFLSIRIRIRIQIQGLKDQKLGKIYSWKKFIFFKSKIAIYLSLGLITGRSNYRRIFHPSKEYI
jgi:hypothetical protein